MTVELVDPPGVEVKTYTFTRKLTQAEVADILRCSVGKVSRNKKLPRIDDGGRVLYEPEDVQRYIDDNKLAGY